MADDPRKMTVVQLKSRITEMGYSDELPACAASKEEYIAIFNRVSKKRTAELDVEITSKKHKLDAPGQSNGAPTPSVVDQELSIQRTPPPQPQLSPPLPSAPSQAIVPNHIEATQQLHRRSAGVRYSQQQQPPPQQQLSPPAPLHQTNQNRAHHPSEVAFTPRRVPWRSAKNRELAAWAIGGLLLLLALWLANRTLCTAPTFCDYEGVSIGMSSVYTDCVGCPENGFCADGYLVACEDGYVQFENTCTKPEDIAKHGVFRRLWGRWFCDSLATNSAVISFVLLVLLSYKYWYYAAKEEDIAVLAIAQELKECMSKNPTALWSLDEFQKEVARKYSDFNVDRLWPQVQMVVVQDGRVFQAELDEDDAGTAAVYQRFWKLEK